MEFDFTIQYKKGAANTVADAISRLPTYGETSFHPDLEVPCFLVYGYDWHKVQERLNSTKEPVHKLHIDDYLALRDFDPEDLFVDEFIDAIDVIYSVEEIKDITPIRIETFVEEQARDGFCQRIRPELDKATPSVYQLDKRGLLVRISPVDKSEQIVVPESLRQKVLYLAHYPRMVRHPGGTRMYHTLRRQ